jgi:D-alanyl-D-alanine carboxypeptidase
VSSGIALTSLGCVARLSDEAAASKGARAGAPAKVSPLPNGAAGANVRASSDVAASAGDRAAGLASTVNLGPARFDTTLDPRSAAAIATLLPAAQRAARRLLASANDGRLGPGVVVKVICGTRTYAEQTALYAQGRTTPGLMVTDAPAGYSNHNFGIAFDVGVFLRGEYQDESPLYARVGAIGRSQDLEWGGDWTSFPDEPHFQLPWPGTLAQARALVAAGAWEGRWA